MFLKLLYTYVLLVAFGLVQMIQARSFNLDEKLIPTNIEDLREIQDRLISHVQMVKPAVVSIDIGNNGFGTGVIVSQDGLVLTAAHVSQMIKKEVKVILNDGTELKARALGLNSTIDSAMVQIEEEGDFPYVELEKEDDLQIGHWVFAMGHPGGFDKSRGAVVRLGRIIRTQKDAYQSDSKLIGGDSGGPLFNMNGKLVAIHSRVGQTKENNMHVPIPSFLADWDQMLKGQFIGSGPFTFPIYTNADVLGIDVLEDKEKNLYVHEVLQESVADKAGLEKKDRLLKLGDANIEGRQSFMELLIDAADKESVSLSVLRAGEELILKLENKSKKGEAE